MHNKQYGILSCFSTITFIFHSSIVHDNPEFPVPKNVFMTPELTIRDFFQIFALWFTGSLKMIY